MRCPFCQSFNVVVVDSRLRNEGTSIWRRRECLTCGKRFSSREKADYSYLAVIKKDGRRQPFSREKIFLSMVKSLGKRSIPEQKLEKAVEEIVQEIHKLGQSEIESSLIGNLVLEQLFKLDLVAYIRFASVFKDFKDVETFKEEIETLLKK